VLIVADPTRVGELAAALHDPLPPPYGELDVSASCGGDDTIDLFGSRRPPIVIITASLELGDAKSLIETLRGMAPRGEVAIVLIGDDDGPIRNAIDAMELAPDRFVSRPLAEKALRFAVQSGLEAIAARGDATQPAPARTTTDKGTGVGVPGMPGAAGDDSSDSRTAQRARWAALADAIGAEVGTDVEDGIFEEPDTEAEPLPPPIQIHPRGEYERITPLPWQPGTTEVPSREPTLILRESAAAAASAAAASPTAPGLAADASTMPGISRSSRGAIAVDESGHQRATTEERWPRASTNDTSSSAELPRTLTGAHDVPPGVERRDAAAADARDAGSATPANGNDLSAADADIERPVRARTTSDPPQSVGIAQRGHDDDDEWSQPIPLRELVERAEPWDDRAAEAWQTRGHDEAGAREPTAPRSSRSGHDAAAARGADVLDLDDLPMIHAEHTPPPLVRAEQVEVMAAGLAEPSPHTPAPYAATSTASAADAGADASTGMELERHEPERPAGRDFARRLREKMSQMAQRLFQDGTPSPAPVDVRPRHDYQTEIDLAALSQEPALGGGVTEIESRRFAEVRELTTSPGSWDTQVRERGLPDSGEIVRGVSDAAMLLAKLFAQAGTGRVGFRRDDVEKVIYFDNGRPVFASSNEPGDRMGELLVREGKITAAQYERCQNHVAQSGRRMGEILVDFGYLKRRELLPAVRRHVEDIVYSLFGWDYGHYHLTAEPTASGERIRLSRHPASLILEGVRRKLDRSTLERLVGPPSTVVEVRDRERLGGVVSSGDLGNEERAALVAFDGQSDLAAVARAAACDVADILPLAWGLCVLGLATLRRADAELEEATALVGETDLAIDRERVRARWQLVTEADYFALLGVRRDATGFEIRRAYQAARRDFASDGFPPDLRRELARELDDIAMVLDEAFRVLRDDRLRGTYLSNLID
jgi:hypothetical protein